MIKKYISFRRVFQLDCSEYGLTNQGIAALILSNQKMRIISVVEIVFRKKTTPHL